MDAEYLPVEQVAQLLAVSTRHAHRACQKAGVRSSKAGKRTVYHRLDVERLAVELGAEYRTVETPAVATETGYDVPCLHPTFTQRLYKRPPRRRRFCTAFALLLHYSCTTLGEPL